MPSARLDLRHNSLCMTGGALSLITRIKPILVWYLTIELVALLQESLGIIGDLQVVGVACLLAKFNKVRMNE